MFFYVSFLVTFCSLNFIHNFFRHKCHICMSLVEFEYLDTEASTFGL